MPWPMPALPVMPRDALPVVFSRVCGPCRCSAGSSSARRVRSPTVRREGTPSSSKGERAEQAGDGAVVDDGDRYRTRSSRRVCRPGTTRGGRSRMPLTASKRSPSRLTARCAARRSRAPSACRPSRVQAADDALGGDAADVLRAFETAEIAGAGEPVVALHGSAVLLRHGDTLTASS